MFFSHRGFGSVACLALLLSNAADAKPPKLVSKDLDGLVGNGSSYGSMLSAVGRHVAFESYATNFSPDDSSASPSVYVRDFKSGKFELVSRRDDDVSIPSSAFLVGITSNGRRVAFMAAEPGAAPGFNSPEYQLYIRDRKLGKTTIASLDYEGNAIGNGIYRAAISPSGRYVVFATDTPFVVDGVANGKRQIYFRDLESGTIELISVNDVGAPALDECDGPRVSANGRYVFFISIAANLVTGDSNGSFDVFVRDRKLATTKRISVGVSGQLSDATIQYDIDAAGKRVVFVHSGNVLGTGSTFGGLYVNDWKTDSLKPAGISAPLPTVGGVTDGLGLSGDGKRVVFASYYDLGMDLNGSIHDVYCCEIESGTVRLITHDLQEEGTDDDAYHPAISADGEFVSYDSDATDVAPMPINGKRQVYRERL